jgi:hypothetical protein
MSRSHSAYTEIDFSELLLARLRRHSLPIDKVGFVQIVVAERKTIVLVVKPDGEHIVLEDETALFPSDQLVVAFQLLLG